MRVAGCRLLVQMLSLLSVVAPSAAALAATQEADALFREGQYERVLEVCSDILTTNPADLDAHLLAGQAALNLDRLAIAEKHFRAALKLEKDNVRALAGLGRTLAARNRLEEAADLLRAALRQNNADTATRLALAGVYKQLKDFDKAADELTLILIDEPDKPPARRALADIAVARNRPNEAVEHLESLVASDSATFPDFLRLALLCEDLNDLAKTAEYAAKAREVNGRNHQLNGLLGRLAFADKRYEDAIALIEDSLSGDPENPRSLLVLAQSHDALSHVELAISAYEDFLKIRQNNTAAKRRLAELYESTGRLEQARQYYVESASGDDVDEAVRRLDDFGRRDFVERAKRFLAGDIFIKLLRAALLLLLAVLILIRYRRQSRRLAERIEHVITSIRRADERVRKRDDD